MSGAELAAGVVGVGSMGQNHARIYDELDETDLVGVFDVDEKQATEVANTYETAPLDLETLFDDVDVVSIAVPTQFHADMARQALEADTHVLVEKPFVEDHEAGRELVDLADARDLTLQVGHVERFNPAIETLRDIVDELNIHAASTQRLGPPLDREIEDTVVMDIMIHDLDVVLDIVDGDVTAYDAVGTQECAYATANVQFDTGVAASLTASRLTQEKVRSLTISAEECRVKVDYLDQEITIHRSSVPSYTHDDSQLFHRHENVVETLTVEQSEPLKNELASFVDAARTGREPVVTGAEALDVLALTQALEDEAQCDPTPAKPLSSIRD